MRKSKVNCFVQYGKPKTERKRNGALINYTFDNNQRVIVKDYVDNTKQRDIYYDYDLRGLQTVESFGATVATSDRTAQKYDGFGNLITDFIYMGGVARAIYSQYDLNNNRTRVTHTDTGTYFTYGFDGLNRMQVIYEGGGTRMLEMNYGQDGRRQRIYRRSGVSATNYAFSNGVQLSSINQDFPNNSYDLTNSFQYTASGQISQLTLGNSLYYYHGNDNRTGNYTVNGLNQYTYVGGATQGVGQPMAYDANANLTNDGTLTYQYDDENRLISTNGSVVSSFTYDPRGRLFQTIINGTKTQYLYDGDALVAEYDTNGTLQRRYVHGDRVDEPLVQYNSSALGTTNWRYLHADHQGSIIAQSDVNGNVLSTLSYDSYGIPATGNTDRFGYTGQIWFKELGLFYYKARMYHPKLGRFMQNDPIGYKDDMDLYSYVGNDPVNKTDPTGLESKSGCYHMATGIGTVCGEVDTESSGSKPKTSFVAPVAPAAATAVATEAAVAADTAVAGTAMTPLAVAIAATYSTKVGDGTLSGNANHPIMMFHYSPSAVLQGPLRPRSFLTTYGGYSSKEAVSKLALRKELINTQLYVHPFVVYPGQFQAAPYSILGTNTVAPLNGQLGGGVEFISTVPLTPVGPSIPAQ